MRSIFEREILFLDLILTADPHYAPIQSMEWFIDKIQHLHTTGETAWVFEKGTKKLKVKDFHRSKFTTTILLYLNDKHGPDAAFCDFDTDEQREEKKGKNEGRPETAHLLVSLNSSSENQNRYMALLEVSPSIPRAIVVRYLRFLFSAIKGANPADFEHPTPDGVKKSGKRRTYNSRVIVDAQGHIAENFAEELAAGKLRGVSLVTHERQRIGVGESQYVVPNHAEVRLSPVRGWGRVPDTIIEEIRRIGRASHYETAKIIFETADNVTRTAELDNGSGRLRNDGFVKKRKIKTKGLENAFAEAAEGIVDILEEGMLSLLSDATGIDLSVKTNTPEEKPPIVVQDNQSAGLEGVLRSSSRVTA